MNHLQQANVVVVGWVFVWCLSGDVWLHGQASQLDTKAVPQPSIENLDQTAARLRPDADKAMADVNGGRCAQRATESDALACLALAEDAVTRYLTLESSFYLRRAERRQKTLVTLQTEMANLKVEDGSAKRTDITGAWLKPMAAEYQKELAALENRLRRGERLSEDDAARYRDLGHSAKTFENLDRLQLQMSDIDNQTREYREKALAGYSAVLNDAQVLAGLDSTKSGLFRSQIGLVGMVISNERQRIRRIFLVADREKESEVERPLLLVPRASQKPNVAPKDSTLSTQPPLSEGLSLPPAKTESRTPNVTGSIAEQYGECLKRQNPLSVCEAFRDCLAKQRNSCQTLLKR